MQPSRRQPPRRTLRDHQRAGLSARRMRTSRLRLQTRHRRPIGPLQTHRRTRGHRRTGPTGRRMPAARHRTQVVQRPIPIVLKRIGLRQMQIHLGRPRRAAHRAQLHSRTRGVNRSNDSRSKKGSSLNSSRKPNRGCSRSHSRNHSQSSSLPQNKNSIRIMAGRLIEETGWLGMTGSLREVQNEFQRGASRLTR